MSAISVAAALVDRFGDIDEVREECEARGRAYHAQQARFRAEYEADLAAGRIAPPQPYVTVGVDDRDHDLPNPYAADMDPRYARYDDDQDARAACGRDAYGDYS